MGKRPPVVGVGGAVAAGIPKGHRSKASPKEGNTTTRLHLGLGKPTASSVPKERDLVLLVKARKGPQAPPTQPLQRTKISLCYRGFNK